MARLQPAEPRGIDLIRRLSYGYAKHQYGTRTEPAEMVAHHRALLVGYGTLEMMAERFAHKADRRLKDLATVRAAQLVGCEWCLDFGSKVVQDAGIAEDDLRELARWRESDRFSELDRLVLEYTEAMTRTPVDVPDELFAKLQEHLDEPQLVEVTMIIALENLRARLNWALGIEGEGFSEGMYCAAPDPAAASARTGALVADDAGR